MALIGLLLAASASAGTIKGRVTDGAGRPIQGVTVCAEVRDDPWGGGCAYDTAADGTYAIEGLSRGGYTVSFHATRGDFPGLDYAPQWYPGKARPEEGALLTPGEGSIEGVDAVMAAGGQITGTATDAVTGRPLAGVHVCADPPGQYLGGGDFGHCSDTAADGSYDIASLGSVTYDVEFRTERGPNYVAAHYASDVPVTAGQVTAGVDIGLQPGLQIEGTVTDAATGRSPEQVPGLDGVSVCALEPVTERRVACTWHEEDGSYALYGLPVGEYVIVFAKDPIEDGYDFPDGYVRRFWPEASNFDEATPVGSPTPTVISGVDGAVSRGEEILAPGVGMLNPAGGWPPLYPPAPDLAPSTTPASPASISQATPGAATGDDSWKVCHKSSRRVGKGRRAHCIKSHGHPVGYHPDRDALR